MRDLHINDLGGVNFMEKLNPVKANSAAGKSVGLFGYGFKGQAPPGATSYAGSTVTVPDALVNKWASVEFPRGKPSPLIVSDKDYIPDKRYADTEV